MINKLYKIALILLMLVNNSSCLAQELKVNNCTLKNINDAIIAEISIINNSNEVLFIPIQYWEVEVIKAGNRVLAYPYEKYAVNRIYIYSNEFNSIKSTGSKCCYPEYKTLPFFLELKPDSSADITITILSNTKLIDTIKYKAEIFICYYKENIIQSQVYNDTKKSEYLITNNKISLQLKDGITNFTKYQTAIKLEDSILIESYNELKPLCEY